MYKPNKLLQFIFEQVHFGKARLGDPVHLVSPLLLCCDQSRMNSDTTSGGELISSQFQGFIVHSVRQLRVFSLIIHAHLAGSCKAGLEHNEKEGRPQTNILIIVSTKQIHFFSSGVISYNIYHTDSNIKTKGYGIESQWGAKVPERKLAIAG
jgi:hypothetical protein